VLQEFNAARNASRQAAAKQAEQQQQKPAGGLIGFVKESGHEMQEDSTTTGAQPMAVDESKPQVNRGIEKF
jgi:hypothetical protein